MLLVYTMSCGSPEQNLRQIFKLLDVDSDGRVSVAEFKTVVSDLRGVLTGSKMDQAIQDLVVEKAFIEMDSDEDGGVTEDEGGTEDKGGAEDESGTPRFPSPWS